MDDPPPAGCLVIKLGALGDFVQAFGPFAAIKSHHPGQRIILLTTEPFADLARASGLFDKVWTGGRPTALDVVGWLGLHCRFRHGHFTRVYDLQTSDRSSFYYRLFWPGPKPEWSGIARGCSHPHANPKRDFMHTIDRQTEQLAMAGIEAVPDADFSWTDSDSDADTPRFGLKEKYALLAPGGAAHRPGKRWPAENFAAVARALAEQGIEPVLIGASAEAGVMKDIKAHCPDARDLAGQTTLLDLAALGRGAVSAIGNDTGPMHLFAAVGCKTVVLYSNESDPALCGQRGPAVTILRQDRLAELSVAEVLEGLEL